MNNFDYVVENLLFRRKSKSQIYAELSNMGVTNNEISKLFNEINKCSIEIHTEFINQESRKDIRAYVCMKYGCSEDSASMLVNSYAKYFNYEEIRDKSIMCPECGNLTKSLKYRVLNEVNNYVVVLETVKNPYFCCPKCMRTHIWNTMNKNLYTGNFAWILFGIPAGLLNIMSTFTKGHSAEIPSILNQTRI